MFPQHTSPDNDVWIAFDLETTGLDDAKDAVIEIGAVKFQDGRTLDTFRTFVNPQRRISPFISKLTGITQRDVDAAPPFDHAAASFLAFIGAAPLVAQNADFDVGFLRANGIELANPIIDTYDLAYALRPDMPGYSLEDMTRYLGIENTAPHRSLGDASATRDVFLALLEEAYALDAFTLAALQQLAQRSGWQLGYLLDGIAANPRRRLAAAPMPAQGAVGVNGLDIRQIGDRLRSDGGPLRARERISNIDADLVGALLSDDGALSYALDGFEERSEQAQMAKAVANAINDGRRIIIEAGTGVGKSLAYLLPAALYAMANGKRVVVSTNTINLQEQLINKDAHILVKALQGLDKAAAGQQDDGGDRLRFTQLKGRGNYLCLRRWNRMRADADPSVDEARLLAKTMVWLQSTASGDRAEINLGHRSAAAPWDRLSAESRASWGCMSQESVCFLRAARERAAASHLIIVNHALLLADIAAEGSIIPEYDALIIDEAHHIEGAATNRLGFDLTRARFDEHLQSLSGDGGLPNQALTALRTATNLAQSRRDALQSAADEIGALLPRLRPFLTNLFTRLQGIAEGAQGGNGRNAAFAQTLRVTPAVRSRPDWSDVEIDWEHAELALAELDRLLDRLESALGDLDDAGLLNYDALREDVGGARETGEYLRGRLKEFAVSPDEGTIYWLSVSARRRELSMNAAPLNVADELNERLFSQKRSVVMTSATLTADGSFGHIVERTGFADADELRLGSPFDYPKAAALCLPTDMPAPNSRAYNAAVDRAIIDAAIAAGGRTMALFTSYGALRRAAAGIGDELQAQGISLLTQGAGSSPDRLVRRFMDNSKAVLLGTASFWEGVDLAGDALSVLIVARLPFSVPTDPVFEARSELYDNSFMQYAVPQAILRLRQGFGRLIRTSDDRGVVAILDSRVLSTRYGGAFLRSLPPASQQKCRLAELGDAIRRHLG